MKSILEFKHVSVSKNGDYYQIIFDNVLDTDDEPYFLFQRDFECPEDGACYIESHNPYFNDHTHIQSMSLSTQQLRIVYGEKPRRDVDITFELQSTEIQALASTLTDMFPEITIEVT